MKHILFGVTSRRIMYRLPHKLTADSWSLFCKPFPALVSHLLLKASLLSLLPKLIQGSLSSGETHLVCAQSIAPAHSIHGRIRPTGAVTPTVVVGHQHRTKSTLAVVHASVTSRRTSVHGPVPIPRAPVPVAATTLTIHTSRPTARSPRPKSDH